jgi:hypothetical protein
MNRGYLFLCFGKYYVDEASNLVRTLRKFGDEYPVSILCNSEDVHYANSTKLFDKVIVFDFDNEFSKMDKTPFEKYGGTPKILMMEYSPYDETIYTDTDMLVQSNTKSVWDEMALFNQPYVLTGLPADGNDPLIASLSKKLNKNITDMNFVHSGIVYYNKTHKDFNLFLETLKYFWKNYDEYNLSIRDFRGGKADEHAIFAAITKLNYEVINPTKVAIITHNYHGNIELPSNIVTGGDMHNILAKLNSPIPFIHMFKHYREHYDILYNRLINM